jgi:hypothetical protein
MTADIKAAKKPAIKAHLSPRSPGLAESEFKHDIGIHQASYRKK